MRKIAMALGATVLAVSLSAARAAPLVDQSFAPPFLSSSTGVTLGIPVAQTFTVGIKGQLASANVAIVGSPPVPCTSCFLDFEIRRTVEGAPSDRADDVLARVLLSTDELPRRPIIDASDFFAFDLTSFEIMVSPGDHLAMVFIALSSIENNLYRDMARLRGCHSNSCQPYGDPYAGGEFWFMNDSAGVSWTPVSQGRPEFNDVAFQTLVIPGHIPEPPVSALWGLGLLILAASLRKKPKT